MSLPLFDRPISTPSEVNRLIKKIVEGQIDELWVRGEISNFIRAGSGHLYFGVKDRQSQLRCVFWKTNAARLRFQPADGMEVEVKGRISVYEPRGEYQLSVSEMNPAGLGALYVALEALKKKLGAEGLFDPGRKRALPAHPDTIGIVTSPSGAAIRDIIRVARRRWPGVRLVLAPARVQGDGASLSIAAAIRRLNRWGQADVLIVGRGGGSIEDLWAFNEEPAVRAVAASRIPVVSAVGHEIDVTLCDLAADRRAATPSNAAEIVVPDGRDLLFRVERLHAQLHRSELKLLAERRRRVESIASAYGFKRPRDFLDREAQRVDDLARRLAAGTTHLVEADRRRVVELEDCLKRAVTGRFTAGRSRIERLEARISNLNPLAVLSRGYCLVQRGETESVVSRAADLDPGETVRLRFSEDEAAARVEAVGKPGPPRG
jgi:exodeoxyribonuclease VII large subunit